VAASVILILAAVRCVAHAGPKASIWYHDPMAASYQSDSQQPPPPAAPASPHLTQAVRAAHDAPLAALALALVRRNQRGLLRLTFLIAILIIAMRPSLDRIDSDEHYDASNVQLVCRFINFWKRDTPDEEFRQLITAVRE